MGGDFKAAGASSQHRIAIGVWRYLVMTGGAVFMDMSECRQGEIDAQPMVIVLFGAVV